MEEKLQEKVLMQSIRNSLNATFNTSKEFMNLDLNNFTETTPKQNRGESETLNIDIPNEENTQNIKKSTRLYWVDSLRVFSCFLVILTHVCISEIKPEPTVYEKRVLYTMNALCRPCVPLFVMISGLLFLNPKKKISIKKLYSKYILRILKSFIFWAIYYCFVEPLIYREVEFNKAYLEDGISKFVRGHNHLWYLPFVMGLYMVTPLFKSIISDRNLTWYIISLFSCVSQLIPTVCYIIKNIFIVDAIDYVSTFLNSLKIETSGSFTVYFLLGYMLNTEEFSRKYIILSYAIGVLGQALTLLTRFIATHDNLRYLDFHCFHVAMATLGTFMFFKYVVSRCINYLIEKKFFKKLLLSLSDCSFGIFLIHYLVLKLMWDVFNFNGNSFNPIICAPLFSIVVFLIGFSIIYLIRKISFFRQIT